MIEKIVVTAVGIDREKEEVFEGKVEYYYELGKEKKWKDENDISLNGYLYINGKEVNGTWTREAVYGPGGWLSVRTVDKDSDKKEKEFKNPEIEEKVMIFKVRVEQNHIDEGKPGDVRSCPISLAASEKDGFERVGVFGGIAFNYYGKPMTAKFSKRANKFVSDYDSKGRDSVNPSTFVFHATEWKP